MFALKRRIRLQDTDATGALYFAQQLTLALEVFEEFLNTHGLSFKNMLDAGYLLPIVHAKADYLAPLRVDDVVRIFLTQARVGRSSITLDYVLYHDTTEVCVGKVQIVHVAVGQMDQSSMDVPAVLQEILCKLSFNVCNETFPSPFSG